MTRARTGAEVVVPGAPTIVLAAGTPPRPTVAAGAPAAAPSAPPAHRNHPPLPGAPSPRGPPSQRLKTLRKHYDK